jgi:hypothetical protein
MKDLSLLIVICLVELALIIYLLIRSTKQKSFLRKEYNFLSALTDPNSYRFMEALSFELLKTTPSDIISGLTHRIELCYNKLIMEWSLYRFGEYVVELEKLSEPKRVLLTRLLKEATHRLDPVALVQIVTRHISSIPKANYNRPESDMIECGKEMIVRSILKNGTASSRVEIFQKELKNSVDLLLNDKNNFDEEERVLMNAYFINIKQTLENA